MERYIDADALKERLEDFSKWCKDGRKQGVDFVLDCPLPDMPTADVVPKSEVERLEKENEKLTINMNAYGLAAKRLAEEKTEIFAEIEKITNSSIEKEHFIGAWFNIAKFEERLAELKKKYTEGE